MESQHQQESLYDPKTPRQRKNLYKIPIKYYRSLTSNLFSKSKLALSSSLTDPLIFILTFEDWLEAFISDTSPRGFINFKYKEINELLSPTMISVIRDFIESFKHREVNIADIYTNTNLYITYIHLYHAFLEEIIETQLVFLDRFKYNQHHKQMPYTVYPYSSILNRISLDICLNARLNSLGQINISPTTIVNDKICWVPLILEKTPVNIGLTNYYAGQITNNPKYSVIHTNIRESLKTDYINHIFLAHQILRLSKQLLSDYKSEFLLIYSPVLDEKLKLDFDIELSENCIFEQKYIDLSNYVENELTSIIGHS